LKALSKILKKFSKVRTKVFKRSRKRVVFLWKITLRTVFV